MTELLNNYIHILCFSIDNNIPKKYIIKFEKLKHQLENNDNNHFSYSIKEYCKLAINKNLPILNRCEGGLGGDNNLLNKQIRYNMSFNSSNIDYEIKLNVLNSDDISGEKWTYEELNDIMRAFIKLCNDYIKCECVNGYIKLKDMKSLDDNYLDSETD